MVSSYFYIYLQLTGKLDLVNRAQAANRHSSRMHREVAQIAVLPRHIFGGMTLLLQHIDEFHVDHFVFFRLRSGLFGFDRVREWRFRDFGVDKTVVPFP